MKMKNPPHPGRLIKHECLEPLNLSITGAADHSRCNPPYSQQSCERQKWRFTGNGYQVVQGLRQQPGGMAWFANGL